MVLLKPDAVERNLVGEILTKFEKKGFKMVGMKFMMPPKALLEAHYQEHKERPFYPGLIEYMSAGPIVSMVWEGLNVIKSVRTMMGTTDPSKAPAGTIRGDLCVDTTYNLIHGSDSPESATREISLWFKEAELVQWTPTINQWLHKKPEAYEPKKEEL